MQLDVLSKKWTLYIYKKPIFTRAVACQGIEFLNLFHFFSIISFYFYLHHIHGCCLWPQSRRLGAVPFDLLSNFKCFFCRLTYTANHQCSSENWRHLSSPQSISPFFTSLHLLSLLVYSPRLSSSHLTSTHLSSPYHTSPLLTSPSLHRMYAITKTGNKGNEAFHCIQRCCTALRPCLRGEHSRRGVQYCTTIVLILSLLFLIQLHCLVQHELLFRIWVYSRVNVRGSSHRYRRRCTMNVKLHHIS